MVVSVKSQKKLLPIGLAIIHKSNSEDQFLFIKRKNEPYKGYWGLVGGKLEEDEHIIDGILREVSEETQIEYPKLLGFAGVVSEHLVRRKELIVNFLIFVAHVEVAETTIIDTREGELKWFSRNEIIKHKSEFIPSDWNMFMKFTKPLENAYFDAVINQVDNKYELEYFE